MHIVYILISATHPNRYYIGYTTNLKDRLIQHNTKDSGYSKRYAPWQVVTYITFNDSHNALKFEKYLKAGSGQAFLKKHLLPENSAK
ncbi:MAG: excinuclease ABC subunit C [Candidatus Omnitrophica bacterium CG07_land_8_20_14_0_80_42_15]|uniref:Excinuclease ABC subunit C n=1 Tax=Candidatus Aquitaenariimonas noxiae TaxID=1974741 RepID=A0A2J0KQZ1_9BACT|nr:MAG: excinuclease ABC subunit C [Candidatus Omnitrophica bacterium CG07_land_8_20_14_0_80_42_15]